jgi:signal transduction histidine kinase
VQINEIVQAVLEQIQSSLPLMERHIEYKLALADNLSPVYAARKGIYDAVFNLVNNAVQAMPNGGTLAIATRSIVTRNRRQVEIEIRDTGIGISPQNLPRIFDLFYTTKSDGLGLGLWQARASIRAHGGEIDVRSHEGEGTTFTITIPVSDRIQQWQPDS